MKRIPILLLLLWTAGSAVAQTLRTERIVPLSAEQKAALTDVTLTGTLTMQGNSDFRQLRDLCFRLRRLDLSKAQAERIPDGALHSRHVLQRVVLPERCRSVGRQAFFACDSLTHLRLPSSVDTVRSAAFAACTRLERVDIDGSPYLGDFSFAGCRGLREVHVSAKVPPVISPTAFAGLDRGKCRLVVPRGSERAYRKAAGWSLLYETRRPVAAAPDSVNLIPLPAMVRYTGTRPMVWNAMGSVEAPAELQNEREHLLRVARERAGVLLGSEKGKGRIRLTVDRSIRSEEGYRLHVHPAGIDIAGRTPKGVFYGIMTLEQMMMRTDDARCGALPGLYIEDEPRTELRELMVDPARQFIPMSALKQMVQEMARMKFNALHLHLVDDQAWRIEIKAYPRLTEVSSSRVGMDDRLAPVSGYYTQQEMRELVGFAARYHVMVIPEVELPGHEVAAIHAYPWLTCSGKEVPLRTTSGVSNELLCPGRESTYRFLGTVLGELADVFPAPYVHLGGDEAGMPPLDCWTKCDSCRDLKLSLGITDTLTRKENWRLQEVLFNRVIDTLQTKHGKTPMFWYETDFKRIPQGCIVYAWRHGLTATAIEAAIRNRSKIMLCPGEHCYFDYPMGRGRMPEVNWGMPHISLAQAYALDPAWGRTDDFEAERLSGVAGTLWSECIDTPERMFHQAFPRAAALSEAGWSRPENRSYESFAKRLRPLAADWLRRGVAADVLMTGEQAK